MKLQAKRRTLHREPLVRFCATIAVVPMLALADGPEPYEKPDDAFITLSGRVANTSNGEFELNYGDGTILVEMDDWDRGDEARPISEGDNVTVYGRIDDDFFEATTIEAGAVYVEGLNSYFYASSADEESAAYIPRVWVTPSPMPSSELTVRGEVASVDRDKKTFTVALAKEQLVVDTSQLGYDPVDDYGYQKIETGDLVSVSGELDFEVFEGKVMKARSLTKLVDESESDA
jgi:uncharacterized protein YdeI (BOF family)